MNSSKSNKHEIESKVSGPLSPVLDCLSTNMKKQAREQKQTAGDIPARDLAPFATYEPSMASVPGPINFHASDPMDIDDDSKDPASASKPDSKPKTKLELAQDYLKQAREKFKGENPKIKGLITAPTSSGARSPAYDWQLRPAFAVGEDPKAQLMRVLYGDPTWTAQRILEENDESRKANKESFWGDRKADEEDFWDEF